MGRDLASRYWKYRATASRFPILRTPDTFSWLTQSAQGRGVGTVMRQMICALFFDELDAHAITSGAYADNPASAAVSRKVGFVPNGTKLELRDDMAAEPNKFILTLDRFITPAEPVTVGGGEVLRTFAGVARPEDA